MLVNPENELNLLVKLYQSELYFIPKRVRKNILVGAGRSDDGTIDFICGTLNKQTDLLWGFVHTIAFQGLKFTNL